MPILETAILHQQVIEMSLVLCLWHGGGKLIRIILVNFAACQAYWVVKSQT
jgi:hypothetical protein